MLYFPCHSGEFLTLIQLKFPMYTWVDLFSFTLSQYFLLIQFFIEYQLNFGTSEQRGKDFI